MYLENYIGNSYTHWWFGDRIFIKSATGTGKTKFILWVLLKMAIEREWEILYLTNRKISVAQIKRELCEMHGIELANIQEISEFQGICVKSYQNIEEWIEGTSLFYATCEMQKYQIIVFDEAHYFVQDATFNSGIFLWEEMLRKLRNPISIFMSATLDEFQQIYMQRIIDVPLQKIESNQVSKFKKYYFPRLCGLSSGTIWEYNLDKTYDYVTPKFFNEIDEIAKIISLDKTEEKWLIFVSNKKKANELMKILGECAAYVDADTCAEDSKDLDEIIKRERFIVKVLVCTQVLDNGINLHDSLLKNIVIMSSNKTEFLQMLGRKRIKSGSTDRITLYLPLLHKNYFNGLLHKNIEQQLRYVNWLKNSGNELQQEFFQDTEFCRFMSATVKMRKGRAHVSMFAEAELNNRREFCEKMIAKFDESQFAFAEEQMKWMNLNCSFELIEEQVIGFEEKNKKKLQFISFLNRKLGVIMRKEEQLEFRREFARFVKEAFEENLTDREERLCGLNIINKFLRGNNMEFEVIATGRERNWMVKNADFKNDACGS